MSWKVISFYTENYKEEVSVLIKSLEALKIPYDIELVKSKGSWKENAFYKIPFIIKKLKEYGSPLVWLDADAEVMKYPSLFDDMGNALIGGVYTPLKKREFVSNVMYLVPSKEAFGYLNAVNKFIKDVPTAYDGKLVGEQYYMQLILEANDWKGRLRFKDLPYTYGMASYWKKCEYYSLCKEDFVIKQHQASRRKDPVKMQYYQSLGLSLGDE